MNLLKDVLANEVYPAFGCTEPISCAYAAAIAAAQLGEPVEELTLKVDADRTYLRRGIEMNLAMSEWGFEVGGVAQQLRLMQREAFLADDMFFRTKLRVASAVDGRMAGMSQAVMTSGGSGNQGVVAIMTPYIVGRERKGVGFLEREELGALVPRDFTARVPRRSEADTWPNEDRRALPSPLR